MKILMADDDLELTNMLGTFFIDNRHSFRSVSDGVKLLKELNANATAYQLVILDINMPHMDGLEACRKIRECKKYADIPILMLTSAKEDIDKIIGLELGADDYMSKPFNIRELLARLKAILRRSKSNNNLDANHTPKYEFNQWILNTKDRTLTSPKGAEVIISSGIYNILLAMVENPQRVLSRDQLMGLSQSKILEAFDRTIDVQIGRLRKKLELDPKNPKIIKTVRSGGYIFTATVTDSYGELEDE